MEVSVLTKCSVDGCAKNIRRPKMVYCNRHDLQMRRNGKIIDDVKPQNQDGEIWVPMFNCFDYEVSSLGRVRSRMFGRYKILSSVNNKKNRKRNLIRCGSAGEIQVHMAVATAFHPNPFGDTRIIFLDGDELNCRADNVQWISVYWRDKSILNLRQDDSKEAKAVLGFMMGDKNSMNDIFTHQIYRLPKIAGYLMTFYRQVYGVRGGY